MDVNIKISHKHYIKRIFNPNNTEDLKEYYDFLNLKSWKNGCSFFLEWPFLSIPDMIQSKIVREYLPNLITNKTMIGLKG